MAADFYEQAHLWEDQPRPEETAFELFGAALNDVVERRVDSTRYDPPLLRRIGKYNVMLRRGVERVTMAGVQLPEPGRIDADVVSAAQHLAAVTPSPRRVRVAGRLDVMGASESLLKIEVRPGEIVTALWERDEAIENYRDLFNKDVVVEGLGVFRPSGALLRIDADTIIAGSAQHDFFRNVPSAPVIRDYQRMARLKPGERPAYKQLRGSLESDESDEEFESALAALR